MDLKNQVTSLELSQKLEKLGVKQDSLWWWCDKFPLVTKEPILITNSVKIKWEKVENEGALKFSEIATKALMKNICSAFTIAELFQIIYDEGLYCSLPYKLRPDLIACYLATYLIMELQKKSKLKEQGKVKV